MMKYSRYNKSGGGETAYHKRRYGRPAEDGGGSPSGLGYSPRCRSALMPSAGPASNAL
jgi:hypothetical protein